MLHQRPSFILFLGWEKVGICIDDCLTDMKDTGWAKWIVALNMTREPASVVLKGAQA